MAKVPNAVEKLPPESGARALQTDDRQTDGRATANSERSLKTISSRVKLPVTGNRLPLVFIYLFIYFIYLFICTDCVMFLLSCAFYLNGFLAAFQLGYSV